MKRVRRDDRERLLSQKGKVIWLTGLPCSGKTTLSINLELSLYQRGVISYVLDGDILRAGINSDLGFSADDRLENVRRVAEIAKAMADCGIVVICSLVSPTHVLRQHARKIVGEADFFEVYVDASVETCERRDVKGMYARARCGDIQDFTGVSASFEIPIQADVVVNTEKYNIDACVGLLMESLGFFS